MYSSFLSKKIKKNGMYDKFLFHRGCKLGKIGRDKSNKHDNEVLKMSICISTSKQHSICSTSCQKPGKVCREEIF